MTTVAEALSGVMADVQSIAKDRKVTEGPARFSFRGVDDVMLAVGPALRKHGVIFAPTRVLSIEHERYATAKGSQMDGVTVVVEYTITGPAGDQMLAAAAGQAADSGDKAVPKAMSVAFRTVLLQALCIPTGDPEPDATVHERAVDKSAAEREALRAEIFSAGQGAGLATWTDIASDFASWGMGATMREASPGELARYRDHLRTASPAGVQS